MGHPVLLESTPQSTMMIEGQMDRRTDLWTQKNLEMLWHLKSVSGIEGTQSWGYIISHARIESPMEKQNNIHYSQSIILTKKNHHLLILQHVIFSACFMTMHICISIKIEHYQVPTI